MFDWGDLRYFLAVAREGSTLAAAKALGLSQSTVHRRLAVLEARFGRRLVHRRPTGYRLTKFGEEIRPYAERVEASVADLEHHLTASDPNRTIRIACPASAAHRLMAARLPDKFHARHPRLRMQFVMTEEFLDLARGEVDLAIRQGAPADGKLVVRKLADVAWTVFASEGYIRRHGSPKRPEDLAAHSIVEFDGPMKHHAAALWMRSVAPGAAIVARGNSVSEILLAIRSGIGLAPLPVPFAREADLVAVLDERPELTFPFYLVVHEDLKDVRRVRAFLDFVTAETRSVRRALTGEAAKFRKPG